MGVSATLKRRRRSTAEREGENMGAALKRRRQCSYADWASLPSPALVLIMDKLLEPIDHVYFAVVCKNWHTFAREYNDTTKCCRKAMPMLMIPPYTRYSTGTRRLNSLLEGKRRLYSVSQGKVYNNFALQVPFCKRCCGSRQGWVVTIDQLDKHRLSITLMNPFIKAVAPILLPPLDFHAPFAFFETVEFPKVILHSDPLLKILDNNYVVVAIYDRAHRLAFLEAGQKCWTYMENIEGFLTDAIFYKSQVYGVGQTGRILSFNVNSKPPEAKVITELNPFSSKAIKGYLVESTKGDLLHVRRFLKQKEDVRDGYNWYYEGVEFWTENFKVYKLVFNERDGSIMKQVEVTSIGDEALFVGDNYSMSVLASNFPGCQPNSIYYTDDFIVGNVRSADYRGPSDMGIYNLEDATITQHYSLSPWRMNIPPSLWIVPPFDANC